MITERDLPAIYGEERTLRQYEQEVAEVQKAAAIILERFLRRLGRETTK